MKSILALVLFAATTNAAQDTNITITAKGAPALVLTVPAAAKISTSHGMTEIHVTGLTLCLWPVDAAKSVDEGVQRIAEVIKNEVLKFSASSTNNITVAGAPAKHLVGRGTEADDGDPATADVVVFTAGDAVFAACVHGEGNQASEERAPMLAVLKTAKPAGAP